ncbi:MAG: tRNA lysidine(34) synthetase TilS [Alistipes sp.]|nr:tRNA lysidine(34) synthetase TilS [Alistipes sp.]
MTNGFRERFERYIEQNDLAAPGDRILLAVSGGSDSMVMLSLFAECGYDIGVAHCNFMLRGRESDGDEAAVESEASRLGVRYHVKRFDTQAEMERTGESMEMAARRLRYAWFDELRREHGYTSVAIAHHADDSTETFFINLLRGTGLRGLTGIAVRAGRIIRPLMFASRKEILEYAMAHGIAYREDSSNASTKYLRNKIRLGLIPRIREINAGFAGIMRRNIARLTEAQTFIDSAVCMIRSDVVDSADGVDTIHVDRIDPGLPRGFVVYQLLNSAYGFKGDVCDSLRRALERGSTGRRFYSKEYTACIDRGDIKVFRTEPDDPCAVEVERDAVRCYCGNSALWFERCDIAMIKDYGVPEHIAQLDADQLHYPLTLRRWRDGDRFIPFGMNGFKKVSDYLTDAKVSAAERERQFVLLSGEDIVWLVGRRIDDRYRLTDKTDNVLRITKEIV